jgi:hypothetical protein
VEGVGVVNTPEGVMKSLELVAVLVASGCETEAGLEQDPSLMVGIVDAQGRELPCARERRQAVVEHGVIVQATFLMSKMVE